MNEEMRNEIEVTEVAEYENNEVSCGGSGVGKVIIGLAGLGVAAVTGVALKNKEKLKNKRTERMIRKLEKQGYIVEEALIELEDETEIIEETENEAE